MTISEYLKGSFDFAFSDANILAGLTRRCLTADTPLESVDEKSIRSKTRFVSDIGV